jgi:hypothetical protein
MLESQDKFSVQDIYVVKGLTKPLLGRPAIHALSIISNVNLSFVDADLITKNNESYYRARYPKVFKGLGKTNWTYTIALYPNAKPFALSVQLMDTVKAELTRMEKLGVISRIDQPTEWCAGMVVVPKSSGHIRICIDFTKLIMSVKRENVPLPSVEESLAKLANAVVFSKLDANSSFWQTNLATDSRLLLSRHLVDIVAIGYPLELVRLANSFRNACQKRLKGFQEFYVTWTTCSYVDLRRKNTTNV